MKNVKCARCVKCGKEYEAVPNLTNCSCGGILDIIYDYDYIKSHFTKETLKNRVNPTMWGKTPSRLFILRNERIFGGLFAVNQNLLRQPIILCVQRLNRFFRRVEQNGVIFGNFVHNTCPP